MIDPADVVRKLEAGRAVFVRDLRTLAGELERLPLRDAGEVLAWRLRFGIGRGRGSCRTDL
jgi:hypothetical protein